MDVKRFRKEMEQVEIVRGGTELSDAFNEYMQEALKITMEINNKYHTPEEIVENDKSYTGRYLKNVMK